MSQADPPEDDKPQASAQEPKVRADREFLRYGAVNLFWRKSLYEAAQATLRELDYELLRVDCRGDEGFRLGLSRALRWLEQFGYEPWTGNLDALSDAVWNFPLGASKCAALCVENYERLVSSDPDTAHAVLDIVEGASRGHLLDGGRLVALIQTNDAEFQATNLGARGATWNASETLRSSRGLGSG